MSKGETFLIRRAAGDKPGELIRVPDELVLLASAPQRRVAQDVAVQASSRDMLFVLFRHLRKCLAFFLFVLSITAAAAVLLPSQYTSSARLMVRLGPESMLPDPSVQIGKAVVAPIQNRIAEINTELQIVRSRELAEAVVARLGPGRLFGGPVSPLRKLDRDDPAVRAAILQIDRKLEVVVEPDSNVLAINYESRYPEVSRDVVAAYVESFRELRARIYRNPLTADFFGSQQQAVKAQIDAIEKEIRSLKDATGTADIDEQQKVLISRAASIQNEIDKVQQILAAANAGASHPGRSRLNTLLQQQQEVQRQIQKINDVTVQLRTLERDHGVKAETFKQYAAIAQQAGVDTAMANNRLSNISVVQAASMPLKPSKPNRLLIIGVGLFLALSGAFGLAFVAEALDHSIRRPEDLALLGVARSVSIPHIPALASAGKVSKLQKLPEPIAAAASGLMPRTATFASGPWSATDPTAAGESIPTRRAPSPVHWLHDLRQGVRKLAEKLLVGTAPDGTSPRVIALGSPAKGQGATTIACATAALLAERVLLDSPKDMDSAVLLIDADLHAPTIHSQLGVELSPGLTDWLADPGALDVSVESTIKPTCVDGLFVMPAGALRGGALTPSRLKRLIDVVAANYRYVLVDLPPLNDSPEAARLSAVCDGLVLVMESEVLRKEAAVDTLATLREANVHLLGTVLNKRRYPVPGFLYDRV